QRKSRFGRHARSTLPSLAPWSSRSHRSGNIPLQTVTRPVTSRSILSALAQVGPVHHTSTSTLRSWFRTRASSAGSDCEWREGSAAVTSSMIRTQFRYLPPGAERNPEIVVDGEVGHDLPAPLEGRNGAHLDGCQGFAAAVEADAGVDRGAHQAALLRSTPRLTFSA